MTSKSILTTLAFLFVFGFSFWQKASNDTDWTTLKTVNGVTISYKKGDCNLPAEGSYTEEVYLKFTNTTNELVFVDWSYDVIYGDRCYNCDGNVAEMSTTFKIEANSSRQGECGDKNDLRLRIFSKFLDMENPEPMKAFNVKNVVVRGE